MVQASKQPLRLADGSAVNLEKPFHMDEDQWQEMRAYFEGNPEAARQFEDVSRDPSKMRKYLRDQSISELYTQKLEEGGDETLISRVQDLTTDHDLASVFDDVRRNGSEAASRHTQDETLMVRIAYKMGGLPQDVRDAVQRADELPLSVHDASRDGQFKEVSAFADRAKRDGPRHVDVRDSKGITPLGYAVAGNRVSVFKLLLQSKANVDEVDNNGNSAVHYSAAYGRVEILEFLQKGGMDMGAKNAAGKTPLQLATDSKQEGAAKFLNAHGGK